MPQILFVSEVGNKFEIATLNLTRGEVLKKIKIQIFNGWSFLPVNLFLDHNMNEFKIFFLNLGIKQFSEYAFRINIVFKLRLPGLKIIFDEFLLQDCKDFSKKLLQSFELFFYGNLFSSEKL